MALRYIDPCGDDYTWAEIADRWNNPDPEPKATITITGGISVDSSGGRCGRSAIRILGYNDFAYGLHKTFDPQVTWIVGFAYKTIRPLTTNRSFIVGFKDNNQRQVSVFVNADGTLSAYRGGTENGTGGGIGGATLLGTSTFAISQDNWFYIEFKATIDNTVGTIDIRVNGNNILSLSGIDTQATSNASANVIVFAGNREGTAALSFDGADYFDDIYVADTQAAPSSYAGRIVDFIGDVEVLPLYANANGATDQDFTPQGAGDHYVEIDETTPDEDTTYLESSTVGHEEFNAYQDMSTARTVIGLQLVCRANKQDAGVRSFKLGIKEGITNRYGPTEHFPSAKEYIYHTEISDKNPATGNQWVAAEVNADEYGIKVET